MVDVNICYDSGIDEFEALTIVDALVDLSQVLPRRKYVNYGNDSWSRGDYGSADWYVKHAKVLKTGDLVQLDSGSLIELLKEEPWQVASPHIDVLVTSLDLTTMTRNGNYINYCFGMTVDRFVVISVARFRKLNTKPRYLSIKRLVAHEMGHVFGMASNPYRPNTEIYLGCHCTNRGCVMQQGTTVTEWANLAMESYQKDMIYCPECLRDLRRATI